MANDAMKWVCVPEDFLSGWRGYAWKDDSYIDDVQQYLSQRPPLPPEIEEAVKRARFVVQHNARIDQEYPNSAHVAPTTELVITRALLKLTGREP